MSLTFPLVTNQVPAGNPTTGFTLVMSSSGAGILAEDLMFLALTSRDSVALGTLAVTDDEGVGSWSALDHSADWKASLWYKRATSTTQGKTLTVANAVGSCSGVLLFVRGATPGTPYSNITVETNASGNETHAVSDHARQSSKLLFTVHNIDNDNSISLITFPSGSFVPIESLSTGGSDCGTALSGGLTSQNGNVTWAQPNGNTYSISWYVIDTIPIMPADRAQYATSFNATTFTNPFRTDGDHFLNSITMNDVIFEEHLNTPPGLRTPRKTVPYRRAPKTRRN